MSSSSSSSSGSNIELPKTQYAMMSKLNISGEQLIQDYFKEVSLSGTDLKNLFDILYSIIHQIKAIAYQENFIIFCVSTCGYYLKQLEIINLDELLKMVMSEFIEIKKLAISENKEHIVLTIKPK